MQETKRIILATDSFKGCLGSVAVESILGSALESQGHDVLSVPMSDGGDGMLEAFCRAMHARPVSAIVHDPLMRPVEACYGIAPDGTAVIETARACGLALMSREELDPLAATSYGVGELILDAVARGCRSFIIGLGGSGTSDAGTGMLRALSELRPDGLPDNCSFTLACDVDNPLYGPRGAAMVFGPQKGASPEVVGLLEQRAVRFAQDSALRLGKDCSRNPGAGAAGGLGYAFMQYLGATVRSGADLLFELAGFTECLAGASLVITGEGHADRQTLMGKLPLRVLSAAKQMDIPVWLVAGKVDDREELAAAGFARVDAVTPDWMDETIAVRPETARENLLAWAEKIKDTIR